jgi:hypothetical protein
LHRNKPNISFKRSSTASAKQSSNKTHPTHPKIPEINQYCSCQPTEFEGGKQWLIFPTFYPLLQSKFLTIHRPNTTSTVLFPTLQIGCILRIQRFEGAVKDWLKGMKMLF